MWDRNNVKVSDGDYLKDVRFSGVYVRIEQVVYNTSVIGKGTHRSSRGGLIGPYAVRLSSLSTFRVVSADNVPADARRVLGGE